jgi:hypothetical protein
MGPAGHAAAASDGVIALEAAHSLPATAPIPATADFAGMVPPATAAFLNNTQPPALTAGSELAAPQAGADLSAPAGVAAAAFAAFWLVAVLPAPTVQLSTAVVVVVPTAAVVGAAAVCVRCVADEGAQASRLQA